MQSNAEALKEADRIDEIGHEAIDPRNAYVMHKMIHNVAKWGTAARATASLKRTDIAGKTGTSNNAFDVWFVGYAGSQIGAVWMGYDQPRSLGKKAQGAALALPVWIDYMKDAVKNDPEIIREKPEGVTEEENGDFYITSRKDAIVSLGVDESVQEADPLDDIINNSVRGQIF